MKKFTTRFLTVFLAIAMLLVSLPMGVFAEELREAMETQKENSSNETSVETVENEDEAEEPYALGEDLSLRTANTKHIRMSDGSYYLAYYDHAVHYEENGAWEEIDNTLVSSAASDSEDFSGFATAKGPMNVKFASNASSSKLLAIKSDQYKISFGLVGADSTKGITVQNPQTEAEAETELEHLIHVKKAVSSVLYADVLENVDLEYIVGGTRIKENIIIKAKAESYAFSFDMKVNKLTAELTENGSIVLKDDKSEEIVFQIALPFMTDANGAYSEAVTYSLEQIKNKEYRITVTPDSAWINDESRAFPVTIDPPITTNNAANITAAMVKESSPGYTFNNVTRNMVGHEDNIYNDSGFSYIYWKITNLPQIPDNCVIIDAKISMTLLETQIESISGGIPIGVYQSSASWEKDTLNWNNRPSSNGTVIDYKFITTLSGNTNKEYSWNITRVAKTWYKNGSNGSVVFKLSTDLYGENNATFASCQDTYNYPCFSVIYRSTVGLEDYYTYNTQSIGRAGTGYINHYTSLLTLVHSDMFSSSESFPFSISHVYNSANAGFEFTNNETAGIHTVDFSKMKLGEGWKLSVQETLVKKKFDGINYLIYNDSDGTEHYFEPTVIVRDEEEDFRVLEWCDEDGLCLKVIEDFDDDTKHTMTDKENNQKVFIDGILTEIIDSNGNNIYFEYNSDNQLKKIHRYTGSSETLFTFNYSDSTNRLQSITDAYGRSMTFSYSNGLLTKIISPDGKFAEYTYNNDNDNDNDNVMISAYDSEANYGIKYTVSQSNSYGKGKVVGFCEYYRDQSNEYAGRKITIEEQSEKSVSYVDLGADGSYSSDDIMTTYRFDLRGRTIGTYSTDAQKKKIYGANTTGYTEQSGASANKISSFSTTGALPINLVSNGSFEKAEDWTLNKANYSTAYAHTGNQSIKLQTTSSVMADAYISQTILMGGAESYTLSVYVNMENITSVMESGGIYLMLKEEYTEEMWFGDVLNAQLIVDEENPWQRITLTFKPEDLYEREFTVYLYMAGIVGSIYVDDFQVEESDGASNYNLIGGIDEWELVGNASFSKYVTPSERIPAISMLGNPSQNAYADLTIPIQKSSDTTFMIGAWACGTSVPIDPLDPQDERKEFEMQVIIDYGDGIIDEMVIPFQSLAVSTPQYLSGIIVPEGSGAIIQQIILRISYSYNANSMLFYNFSLVEESAQTYSYDVNGNLISAGQTNTPLTSLKYDENDRLIEQKQGDQKFTYTYYGNTQLLETVTSNGITSKYTYDGSGNVTGTTIIAEGTTKEISSSTDYTEDENFVSSVTDTTGNTTSYGYDSYDLLEYSQNANGTRVYYKYNTYNDRQTQSYIDGIVFASYEYTKGTLSKITRKKTENDTSKVQEYSFTYDSFGNVTEVKVGSNTLVTYTYGPNNGNLLTTTYGENGMVIENVYDRLDRVTEIKYNGIVKYQYFYNGNGDLSRVKDVSQNTVYLYDYDSLGRLISSYTLIGSDVDAISRYTYDDENKISVYRCGLSGTVGGNVGYVYEYTYDDRNPSTEESTGLLEEITVDGTGIYGDTLSYSYDVFQRLAAKTTVRSNLTLAQEYAYKNLSGNRTTSQISGYTAKVNGTTVDTYSYTYDNLGNITVVNRSGNLPVYYTYDAQNQLVSVLEGDFRYDFTYDTYGNILSVEYVDDYSDEVMSSNTYTYGNAQWVDQLTKFNGVEFEYDQIGNPTKYYNGSNYTFTWNGRELATATKGSTSISYKYGADGLRTQKTVGSTVYNYYYADGLLIRQTWGTNYMDFLYDESGSAYSFIYNGTQYYYIKNLQGDVMRIVDATGSVVANYSYDAWGKVTNSGNIIGLYNPIRYRGYYYDTDTGFYYLQSRYYDPAIKRFISADDASLLGANGDFTSLNLYAYCGNNPVARADDGGEAWHILAGAVIGGLIGGISSIVGQAVSGQKINWAEVGVSAASGALTGAITAACPGMGAVATGIVHGAVGAGTYVATELVNGRTPTVAGTLAAGVTSGVLAGGTKAIGNAISSGKLEIGKIKGIRAPEGYPGVRYKTNAGPAYSVELHSSHNGHTPHLQVNKWLYQYKKYEGQPYRFRSWHYEFFKPWKGVY